MANVTSTPLPAALTGQNLPSAANCTIDIYRGTNVVTGLPSGAPVIQGVKGHLINKFKHGRKVYPPAPRITHVVLLDGTIDIRDAYNSALNTLNPAQADTVMLHDSASGQPTTPFYVVYVERLLRGGQGEHLRVYLDRFQPSQWPTDAT